MSDHPNRIWVVPEKDYLMFIVHGRLQTGDGVEYVRAYLVDALLELLDAGASMWDDEVQEIVRELRRD